MASFIKVVSLLNTTRTTTSTSYTATGDRNPFWYYDSADYDGVDWIKFSATIRATSGDSTTVALKPEGLSEIASSEVTTTSTVNVDVISGDISADLDDANDHKARWKSGAGATASIDKASILISQTNPTKTVTVIEIGEVNNTSTTAYNSIYTPSKPGHAFLYESSKWDGTVEIFYEADIRPRTSGSDTMYSELYNQTDSSSVSSSEVTHTGNTTTTRKRSSALTLTDNKNYIARTKVGSGNGDLAAGKIIIKQTNFTKTVSYIPILNTTSSGTNTTYTAQNRLFTFNASDFDANVTKNFYYEASINVSANTGYSKLTNDTDTSDISEISGTSTTRTERIRSNALTMPTDDGNVLNNYRKIDTSGTVIHARTFLIVELAWDYTVAVTDTVTVSESVGVSVEAPSGPGSLSVSVSDAVTLSEAITATRSTAVVSVSDTVTVSESVSVSVAPTTTLSVAVTDYVDVYDTVFDTNYVIDSVNYTPINGTLKNSATFIATDGGYLRMTEVVNDGQSGQIEYDLTSELPLNLDVSFDFWAGGGNGADGVYFYLNSTTTVVAEYDGRDGYCIAWSEYADQVQARFHTTVIDTVSKASLDNSTWRTGRIIFNGTSIKVYTDGTLDLDITDSARTFSGTLFGFGARTGGLNNEHRVRNLRVSTLDKSLDVVTPTGSTLSVSVSDTVTITETVTLNKATREISVSDTVTVSESVSGLPYDSNVRPMVADSVSITESVSLSVGTPAVSVTETITITESVSGYFISEITTEELVQVDDILIDSNLGLNVMVSESVAISESVERSSHIDRYLPGIHTIEKGLIGFRLDTDAPKFTTERK